MDTESLCNEIRKEMEDVKTNSFPLDVFPQKFQKLLLDLSSYDGYNMEITAMSMLSALSAALGNTLWVHVRGNWNTNASLYVLIVGNPGCGKSQPLDFAYGPIYDRDKEQLEKFKGELEEYHRLSEKGKSDNPSRKPVLVKTVTSDFTVEAMLKLHDNNPHGVALVIDEFPSLLKRVERYHDETIEKLLTAWSMKYLTSDRKSEDLPVCIGKPCVNLIGGIQTNLVPVYMPPELFHNGFIDRVLFVYPGFVKPCHWDPQADDLHCSIKSDPEYVTWSEMLSQVFSLTSSNDPDSFPTRILQFDQDAKEYFYNWVNSIIDENNAIEDDLLVESRNQKFNSQAARLALLIQVLRWACGESHVETVDLASVKAAITLLTYLEEGYDRLTAFVKKAQKQSAPKVNKYAFLDSLPSSFGLKEAEEAIGKSLRTAHNYLDNLCNMPDPLLVHTGHNCYEKVQK